ncbi:helix-turn-helix transcriptional regulator [Telmatospirillum sp.]|uniref:helix-turn-helix domain-containing protein n=1 Tax=Telmatospirillum sp. TaxID=2079197 RepID=UPI0028422D33|nr:helix-turn-helix transcriptional regulator [Telmatospirillum sp.]MDR3438731.1 helix-turn-helix transcriptional regulator [Telmatospirillum sp.]
MTISPEQCRAGRALLDLDQASLALRSNVSRNTVVDFEKGKRVPNTNNLKAIRSALEGAGVEFIPENGGGAGVRLKKKATAASEGLDPEELNASNDD